MSAIEILKAAAEPRSTQQLLACLRLMDAQPGSKSHEERMVYAAMADVVTEREGIDEAMDAVFGDLEFVGTYADAIAQCLAAKVAS